MANVFVHLLPNLKYYDFYYFLGYVFLFILVSVCSPIIIVQVKEAIHNSEDLNGQGGEEHVEGDGGQTVLLQEGHQEAKAKKDHHVHVLEH